MYQLPFFLKIAVTKPSPYFPFIQLVPNVMHETRHACLGYYVVLHAIARPSIS